MKHVTNIFTDLLYTPITKSIYININKYCAP